VVALGSGLQRVQAFVVVVGCALPFVAFGLGGAQQPASIAWVMLLGGSASSAAAVALGRLEAMPLSLI